MKVKNIKMIKKKSIGHRRNEIPEKDGKTCKCKGTCTTRKGQCGNIWSASDFRASKTFTHTANHGEATDTKYYLQYSITARKMYPIPQIFGVAFHQLV